MKISLHHVSVPTADVPASCAFYENVLGLRKIPRPPFSIKGEWYGIGGLQIHIVEYAGANFRSGKAVHNDDIHFALRAENFEDAVSHLHGLGYDEKLPEHHPKRLILKRTGLAGFPQVFLMDPDRNVIEINQAPV
jgi:glyoxylase I family protein